MWAAAPACTLCGATTMRSWTWASTPQVRSSSQLPQTATAGSTIPWPELATVCHRERHADRTYIHYYAYIIMHTLQTDRQTYFVEMYHISILFPLLHILFSIECMYVVCVVCVDNINACVRDFFSVYDMHMQPFWPATRARFPRWLSIPRAPAYLLPPGSPHLYRTPTSVVYILLIRFWCL